MNFRTHRLSQFCMQVKPKELGALLKWLFQIKRELHTCFGFKMWLDPATKLGDSLLNKGGYETAMCEFMERALGVGGTFVDLGANEGFFSLYAHSLVGEKGRVFSIEPQLRLWPILLQNISVNQAFQIKVLPTAVSEKCEDVEMVLFPSTNSGASTLVQQGESQMHALRKRQTVRTLRLDDLLEKADVGLIDVLKVDIEGYEGYALRSAERTLKEKRIKNVAVEYHPARLKALGENEKAIEDYIFSYGYKLADRKAGWAFYTVE